MPPLLLVPCTASKTLPAGPELQGRSLGDLPESDRARIWRERIASANPRVAVRDLYKGGAWSLAREAAALIASQGGAVRVVSAGLGLVELADAAPSYDITFSGGTSDSIPGDGTPAARCAWWKGLGGDRAFRMVLAETVPSSVLVALPPAYLDAVAPCLSTVIETLGTSRVSVFACSASPWARRFISASLVRVRADHTTALRGNAGQASLSALLHVVGQTPASTLLDRPFVESQLALTTARIDPLYPKRMCVGPEHAAAWIEAALRSAVPPGSASQALRRYRDEGYGLEQKHFHRIFDAILEAR